MQQQAKTDPDFPNEYLTLNHITKLDHIRNYMVAVWSKGTIFHPLFTLHGEQHSRQVEQIIGHVLAPEHSDHHKLKNLLTMDELFFLLASAWLHDVGMITPLKEVEKRKIAAEGLSEADWVREVHHERSRDYVMEHKDELHLETNEADSIGQVSWAHRVVNLSDLPRDYPNLRFLGAVLRIADGLDISNVRTPPQLMELLKNDLNNTSRWHWVKHWCVFQPHPDHVELKDYTPSPLVLRYHFDIRLPHPRYKVPFWDRITSPIKETLEKENVGLILGEKNLAIDVEQFKVRAITYEDLLPDDTNFAKYFQKLFAYPSADLRAILSNFKQKNQVMAQLLQKHCIRLTKLTDRQPEGIRNKINEALIRFFGALVVARDC